MIRTRKISNPFSFRTVMPVLSLLAIAFSTCVATAMPMTFDDDFSGPTLDAAWNTPGDAANHLGLGGGSYSMTHTNGTGDPKLSRSTPGTLSSYTHEIEVELNPFFQGGTVGADFKWKMFGANGFMEFVLNSFGDMRLFHNNTVAAVGGNIQPNTNLGLSDGDLLNITTDYNQGTDQINVTYSVNGGSAIPYYSGTGSGGSIGDTITNFVEAQVFQFSSGATVAPIAAIDNWSLSVIPEPTSVALLAVASLCLCGRVKRV